MTAEGPTPARPLLRLADEFPEVPESEIRAVLRESCRFLLERTGEITVDATEQLARLRLELRCGHAAAPWQNVPTRRKPSRS